MVRSKLHLIIFFAAFFSISVIEGIHFILDLRFLYFFLFILPFVLFLLDTVRRYTFPRGALLILGMYTVFSFISLINSLQVGVSLELFLRDISLLLLMVYAYQHKEEIAKIIPKGIVILSFIFIIASLLCIATPYGRYFISGVRLNLLYNPAYLHKTIGDYLTLGVITCLYYIFIKKRKRWSIPLLLLLPVFVLSFSRTAYITLAISFVLMLVLNRDTLKKVERSHLWTIALGIIVLCILSVTFVTKTGIGPLTKVQQAIQSTLYPRTFINSRAPFWMEGIEGMRTYPLTGIGQGNFAFLSYRLYTSFYTWSNTSFNVLIDMFAEQGIAAALCFSAFVIYVFLNAKKNSVVFILLLTLFINFMGFSTYTYTQLWLLFYILAGAAIEAHKGTEIAFNKNILIIPALIGILYIQAISFHYLLICADNRRLAQVFYPFDNNNVETIIDESVRGREYEAAAGYLSRYKHDFSTDPFVLERVGDWYNKMGEPYWREALTSYDESFQWGSYIYGDILSDRMEKFYILKKQLDGEVEARKYVSRFLQEFKRALAVNPSPIQQAIYDSLKKQYIR